MISRRRHAEAVERLVRSRERALRNALPVQRMLAGEWAAAAIERRADAFDSDADYVDKRPPAAPRQIVELTAGDRRVIADELRSIARDVLARFELTTPS